ncbi:MAG: hypothetical protein ABI411_01890 [Tahibacter sp.]
MSASEPRCSEQVAEYVTGRLVGEARERFELALFSDPDLLAAVESESALRSGFRELAAEESSKLSVLPQRSRARPSASWLAMAASFAFGAVLTALSVWPLRSRLPNNTTYANVQVALLEATRGAASGPLLTVSAAAPRIVLQFPVVNSSDSASYSIALSGPALFARQFDGLLADGDGLLSVEMPTADFAAGSYEARISTLARDGTRSEYQRLAFELRR